MKTNTLKYILVFASITFLVACSTKKNNFLSRNSHALSTKYNILYNGGVALDKGVIDLKSSFKDNYWDILQIERMQVSEEAMLPGQTKNANFERAETKAAKAIQKHSMNIGGKEKNPQMDEAHLMLGKSRYYDQRFIPALEAFNYVLYKYPESDKINEIKIWREKTNMRLENDAIAVINLRKLLKQIKFKDQIFADANATLAQAFLNLGEKDSVVSKLKIAKEFTKLKEEKARYSYILGQLYDQQGYKDSAFAAFQDVINMNRNADRQYVIRAHAEQAKQFDYQKGDTLAFLEKFNKLLKDRENRPYLDVINHQIALFYDKNKKSVIAKKYYNTSLQKKSNDTYLIASNYRNIAEINFNDAKYIEAGKYYDSTLSVLDNRSREHKYITKKRQNLDDVIKYEGIAKRNDSILRISKMSDLEKENFYKDYISKLKKEDEVKLKELEKSAKNNNSNGDGFNSEQLIGEAKKSISSKSAQDLDAEKKESGKTFANTSSSNTFYFYNPTTVAYGKKEFTKNWGKRNYGPNWRLSNKQSIKNDDDSNNFDVDNDSLDKTSNEDEKYKTEYYINQLPTAQTELDSIAKERNFAYYQLGVIYKEKFKEYSRAANKLELLLQNNPEERLVLPSLYNLFKIYEIIDPSKAKSTKNLIVSGFPSSRYAQLLNNDKINLELGSPEVVYKNLYEDYQKGLYRETSVKTEMAIVEFTGEEMLPKFELLKADLIGKLYGLAEYKKALNFIALTYPNSEEGKSTENFIAKKIPYLESLYFNDIPPSSWKIIYQPKTLEEKDNKLLLDKLAKFVKERTIETLTVSVDVYTKERNLIVIHGIKSEENAKGISQVLKEFKEYKIQDPATVISSENYRIVQVYKNIEEYISGNGPTFEPKQKPQLELPKPDKPVANEQKKLKIENSDSNETAKERRGVKPQRNSESPNEKDKQKEKEGFTMPPSPNQPQKR